jgi:hypothetical protein
MAKDNYLSLYFDNLSRTASLLEGMMDHLDENPDEEIMGSFDRMALEKKQSIDERAATIRSLQTCEKELAAHREIINAKLKQIKRIQARLKEDTLGTLKKFSSQPFRGDFCQLQINKTRGKVSTPLNLMKVNLSNVIDPDVYATTDIPSDCLGKVTYYYVKKDDLYQRLKAGLKINDATIEGGSTLKIKDLV